MKYRDLSGQKFGKLTVIMCLGEEKGKHIKWLCKCDCGNEKIVQGNHLVEGATTSCGHCFNCRGLRLYRGVWTQIKQRCLNPNCKDYKNYGGRGITICKEWLSFENFYYWAMSHGYADNLTIDRIDVNGNYEPSNCRFVDAKTQCRNKRNNNLVTYKGETLTVAEWSERTHISANALYNRINRGWDLERAFTQPCRKKEVI